MGVFVSNVTDITTTMDNYLKNYNFNYLYSERTNQLYLYFYLSGYCNSKRAYLYQILPELVHGILLHYSGRHYIPLYITHNKLKIIFLKHCSTHRFCFWEDSLFQQFFQCVYEKSALFHERRFACDHFHTNFVTSQKILNLLILQ